MQPRRGLGRATSGTMRLAHSHLEAPSGPQGPSACQQEGPFGGSGEQREYLLGGSCWRSSGPEGGSFQARPPVLTLRGDPHCPVTPLPHSQFTPRGSSRPSPAPYPPPSSSMPSPLEAYKPSAPFVQLHKPTPANRSPPPHWCAPKRHREPFQGAAPRARAGRGGISGLLPALVLPKQCFRRQSIS